MLPCFNCSNSYSVTFGEIKPKVTAYIPEPKQEYEVENQRQILQSISTLKTELNFAFQEELKQEIERFNWYNTRY